MSLADLDRRFAKSGRRSASRRQRTVRRGRAGRVAAGACVLLTAGVATGGVVAGTARERSTPPAAIVSAAEPTATCPVPGQLRPAFAFASRETGVSVRLLVAMAYEESNLSQSALSPAGAQGLLQVMPATARELALDARQTYSNVLGGARYLDQMRARFGTRELALAAYNAGPGAVERAGRTVPPHARPYVAAVTGRLASLGGCS